MNLPSTSLARSALRDDVRDRLEDWIVTGHLAPGARLSDEALSDELRISRTPVREALVMLARDGFVECFHQRGFRVRPLTEIEVREVYPVTASLEALAVRSSGPFEPERLERLRSLADRMTKARTPRARLAADEGWHETLVAGCPNALLRELLTHHKARIRRYEHRYLRQPDFVRVSRSQHEQIRLALARNRRAKAASLVEAHWLEGMRNLLEILRADEVETER